MNLDGPYGDMHRARRALTRILDIVFEPCVRGAGYEHRYCCTVHAVPGAHHGDFPEGAERCRAWPTPAKQP